MFNFSDSENGLESTTDVDEVWAVIDHSSDEDSTIESHEDDVVHSWFSRSGR